ncbi:hypothetical protein IV498_12585 [Paenarthrobacter sp. Z7-10]|uniref:hypothetical protein n=1 Tax=Paenarthrobacter sp. Z7-10 TaxID=2787635 RepID=UPI0022A90950|nr:hypothetical protein [Paenarthrobacter sp. Z7-10]MCZ2403994.1 hypothetical protein [Paenarthrobacter sp. Z7-10]
MHHTGGPGWRITMDTSGPMLIAIYMRDVAGLAGAGFPPLAAAAPAIRPADPHQLTAKVGGVEALREQWEWWWRALLAHHPQMEPPMTPPNFQAFGEAPALQRVLQAHFGAALSWARERQSEYARLAVQRETLGGTSILTELVQDREMELGRNARDFTLTILELPLAEPRAWFVEPDQLIMSQHLLDDQETFRSYVQPVVEMLV